MDDPRLEHATAELKSFDPFSDLVAAAAAAGSTIAMTFNVYPPDQKREDPGPGRPAAGEEDGREERVAAPRPEGPNGVRVRADDLDMGQRVSVRHLNVEGVVSGITYWDEGETDFHVRWNDDRCRAVGGWFKRAELSIV